MLHSTEFVGGWAWPGTAVEVAELVEAIKAQLQGKVDVVYFYYEDGIPQIICGGNPELMTPALALSVGDALDKAVQSFPGYAVWFQELLAKSVAFHVTKNTPDVLLSAKGAPFSDIRAAWSSQLK